jgi:protein-disulfide isomerase
VTLNRRWFLGALAGAGSLAGVFNPEAYGQGAGQWFPLQGDDGKPVANLRLPVELTSEVEELAGAIWVGSDHRFLTLVEFYDYNCPFCRAAVKDIHAVMQAEPELRLGLVNNAILSPKSVEAAKVELALSRLGRPEAVYDFHRRLFERRGTIDGAKAMEVADELGAPRAEVEKLAAGPDVQAMLSAQMSLAASLGMSATPSFLAAGAGILGYPGPKTLKRVVDSVRRCDQIVCRS